MSFEGEAGLAAAEGGNWRRREHVDSGFLFKGTEDGPGLGLGENGDRGQAWRIGGKVFEVKDAFGLKVEGSADKLDDGRSHSDVRRGDGEFSEGGLDCIEIAKGAPDGEDSCAVIIEKLCGGGFGQIEATGHKVEPQSFPGTGRWARLGDE